MAPDVLRCDLGTTKCVSATLFRHTAADPVVGINIFMYGNCASNQRIEPWLDKLFKDLRDTGQFQDTNPILC